MSALDLSHSPSIEAALIGLDNRNRLELVDSVSLEKNAPALDSLDVGEVRGEGDTASYSDSERSGSEAYNDQLFTIVAPNSAVEAQEIAGQKPNPGTTSELKKGLAAVASASEAVGKSGRAHV